MNRRSFLRALGGAGVLGSAGSARAHPGPSGAGTPPSETPTGPPPLGSLQIEGAAEAVVGDETTVFLATTDGFAVADVSDPADPALVHRTDEVLGDREDGPLRGVWDVKADGDRLLVVGPANPGHESVHAAVVFDVADPANPRRVAVHETDYPIHNGFLADGVAYLTANGAASNEGEAVNALVTVDAETGAELGRWSLADRDPAWRDLDDSLWVLHDVWVREGRAYLAHWDAGTWILDVSNPADPTVVSRVRGRSVDELASVEDASAEATTLPGNDHFVSVDESGALLGVGVESWATDADAERGPGGLLLFDVSDPDSPERVARIDPPPTPDPTRGGVWTTAHNFEFVGDRLYSAWYQGGVKVHDVADPANPRELLHWRDAGRAKFWTAQAGVPGEFFVASSWESPSADGIPGGLFTFPDPASDARSGTWRSASGLIGDPGAWLAGLGVGAAALGAWRARR